MDDAAAWASAGATTLAVVVALFGPGFERWRRRPKLVLSDPPPELGTAAKVVGGPTDGDGVVHWLRVAVSNDGRSTAEDVRVILLRIDAPEPLRKQPPSRELKWADVRTDRGSLPPRVARLVDVVHVKFVPDGGQLRRGLVAGVQPVSSADSGQPGSLLWRDLTAGTYVVHVSVSARDVAARHYAISFAVPAAGHPEAVAEALRGAGVTT
ncbi:hypothetical protein [Blastococcus deserti]|uniref:Uncharacterized protein n=1 Tax=Blastococcus deserti TaxID=2259033 RepID=A0ABW4XEW7_9ACTN